MGVRGGAGWFLAGFAGFLLFRSARAAWIYAERSGEAALADPVFLLPLIGGAAALIGGLLAGLSRPGGAILAWIGAGVFALLTGAMAGMGAFVELWRDEAFLSGVLALFALALTLLRRRPTPQS